MNKMRSTEKREWNLMWYASNNTPEISVFFFNEKNKLSTDCKQCADIVLQLTSETNKETETAICS